MLIMSLDSFNSGENKKEVVDKYFDSTFRQSFQATINAYLKFEGLQVLQDEDVNYIKELLELTLDDLSEDHKSFAEKNEIPLGDFVSYFNNAILRLLQENTNDNHSLNDKEIKRIMMETPSPGGSPWQLSPREIPWNESDILTIIANNHSRFFLCISPEPEREIWVISSIPSEYINNPAKLEV